MASPTALSRLKGVYPMKRKAVSCCDSRPTNIATETIFKSTLPAPARSASIPNLESGTRPRKSPSQNHTNEKMPILWCRWHPKPNPWTAYPLPRVRRRGSTLERITLPLAGKPGRVQRGVGPPCRTGVAFAEPNIARKPLAFTAPKSTLVVK